MLTYGNHSQFEMVCDIVPTVWLIKPWIWPLLLCQWYQVVRPFSASALSCLRGRRQGRQPLNIWIMSPLLKVCGLVCRNSSWPAYRDPTRFAAVLHHDSYPCDQTGPLQTRLRFSYRIQNAAFMHAESTHLRYRDMYVYVYIILGFTVIFTWINVTWIYPVPGTILRLWPWSHQISLALRFRPQLQSLPLSLLLDQIPSTLKPLLFPHWITWRD